MADKNLSDDLVKLVSYSIVCIERGHERILVCDVCKLFSDNMAACDFSAWVIADYCEEHPSLRCDKKDLRLEFRVLGRWPKPDLEFEEKQLERLRGIQEAIVECCDPLPGAGAEAIAELAPALPEEAAAEAEAPPPRAPREEPVAAAVPPAAEQGGGARAPLEQAILDHLAAGQGGQYAKGLAAALGESLETVKECLGGLRAAGDVVLRCGRYFLPG